MRRFRRGSYLEGGDKLTRDGRLKGVARRGLVGLGVCRGSPEAGAPRRHAGWPRRQVLGSVPVRLSTLWKAEWALLLGCIAEVLAKIVQVQGCPSLFFEVAQVSSDEPNRTPEQHCPGSEVLGLLFPQRGEGQTRARAKAGSPRAPPALPPPAGRCHGAPRV